jgi:hypothetical protein
LTAVGDSDSIVKTKAMEFAETVPPGAGLMTPTLNTNEGRSFFMPGKVADA